MTFTPGRGKEEALTALGPSLSPECIPGVGPSTGAGERPHRTRYELQRVGEGVDDYYDRNNLVYHLALC